MQDGPSSGRSVSGDGQVPGGDRVLDEASVSNGDGWDPQPTATRISTTAPGAVSGNGHHESDGLPPVTESAAADGDERDGRGRRRSAYATRVLTTGSVAGTLWFLAWPQMLEGVLNIVDQLADYFWAGRYAGLVAIAGLGVAQTYIMLLSTVRQGLDVAMKAMVARAYGTGNVALANHIAMQALTVTLAFVSVVTVLGVIYTETLLRLLGLDDELIAITRRYMQIHFLAFGLLGVRMMTAAALQAAGDSMTPLKATTLTRVTSLVVSPILLFGGIPLLGWAWFPEMGIPGLALAAALGHCGGIVWNSYALLTGSSRLHLRISEYRFDLAVIIELVRIGWPAMINTAERSISQLILIRFVVPFGTTVIAAYSLSRRLMQMSNVGAMGFGRASGILVAQNLGAKQSARARETVLWSLAYVAGIIGCLLGLMFLFPGTVANFFTDSDSEVMGIAGTWIRIMTVAGFGQAIALIFRVSFEVAGDTLAAMIIMFISMWAVEIPMAYFLSHHTSLGHYGVAVGIVIATVLMNGLFITYFLTGRWMRVGFHTVEGGDRRAVH